MEGIMCNCTANENIRKLAEELGEKVKDPAIRKFAEHTLTTCNGTQYNGIITEAREEYIVLEVRKDRGVHETAFVRYCCLCSITENFTNG